MLDQFRPRRAAKHPRLQITIPDPAVDSKGVPNVWGSVVDAAMEQTTEAEVAEYEPPLKPDPTIEGTAIDDGRIPTSPQRPVGAADDVGEQAAEPAGISATIVAFPRGRRPRREVNGAKRAQLRPQAPSRTETPVASPILDMAGEDPLADYGPPTTVTPDEISDGELLELDPDRWVVVESVEQDFANDQEWIVNWRSIDPGGDDSGSVMMPAEATARCRSMSNEVP